MVKYSPLPSRGQSPGELLKAKGNIWPYIPSPVLIRILSLKNNFEYFFIVLKGRVTLEELIFSITRLLEGFISQYTFQGEYCMFSVLGNTLVPKVYIVLWVFGSGSLPARPNCTRCEVHVYCTKRGVCIAQVVSVYCTRYADYIVHSV